jgi:hypothetical protein
LRPPSEDKPDAGSDAFRVSPRWFIAVLLGAIILWYAAELLLPRRLLPLREVAFLAVIVGLFALSLTGRRSGR